MLYMWIVPEKEQKEQRKRLIKDKMYSRTHINEGIIEGFVAN